MVWFRIDDGFPGHPKLDQLLDDPVRWSRALAVWVVAGCYASRYTTDGRVRASRVARECAAGIDVAAGLADLVEVGLLDERDGDLWLHDFLEYNPTASAVKAEREAAKVRKQKSRTKKRQQNQTPVTDESHRDTPVTVTPLSQPPDPTRPDPAQPVPLSPTGEVSANANAAGWRSEIRSLSQRWTKAKKTQGDVATACMVSKVTVSKWVNGKVEPADGNLERIRQMVTKWEAAQAERHAAGKSDHAKFRDWFVERWADHNDGLKYSWAGKDAKQSHILLTTHGLDESRRRAVNMWAHAATGWPRSTADVSCLLSNWNTFSQPPQKVASKSAPLGGSSLEDHAHSRAMEKERHARIDTARERGEIQ